MPKKIFDFGEYGFLFNMYANSITQEIGGVTSIFEYLRQIVEKVGEDDKGQPIFKETPKAKKIILHYFYGAAVAYFDHKGIKRNVTLSDVSDWLEELGEVKAMEIYAESLGTPKNSEAPKETGQN